jgi:hypothetical protein
MCIHKSISMNTNIRTYLYVGFILYRTLAEDTLSVSGDRADLAVEHEARCG